MVRTAQVTVTLEEDLQQFVAEEAEKRGLASDAFIENLLRERLTTSRIEALDEALARGLDDAKQGRVIPLEEAFQRLRRDLQL